MRLALKTSDPVRARFLRRVRITLLVAAVAAALVVGGIAVANAVNAPELRVRGIPGSGVLNVSESSGTTLTVDVVDDYGDEDLRNEALRSVEARLNGELVPTLWVANHRVLEVGQLPDGEYELTVTADPGLLSREITLSRRFVVDSRA
ncbi:hypothetical protein [Streptomyces sp. CC219B]|uniref:hypothetical protein n=1 Tax=Streptomyces sp. CC219B TaxID=3044574 RepID=UPI0024A9F969|nr:hypothetical protein [Streptomyces sp. CC219B]